MLFNRISPKELKNYSTHLKNLSPEDKHTRFCYAISDAGIDKFILSILYDLEKHNIFAATENGIDIGYVHLAHMDDNSWELGVSVDSASQGKGVGNKLVKHAIRWAKVHGIENIFIHCIVDNKRIQHIAKKNGLRVIERSGSDITAMVELPSLSPIEKMGVLINEQMLIIKKIAKLQGDLISNLSMGNK